MTAKVVINPKTLKTQKAYIIPFKRTADTRSVVSIPTYFFQHNNSDNNNNNNSNNNNNNNVYLGQEINATA